MNDLENFPNRYNYAKIISKMIRDEIILKKDKNYILKFYICGNEEKNQNWSR